jgi:hypothetical protein
MKNKTLKTILSLLRGGREAILKVIPSEEGMTMSVTEDGVTKSVAVSGTTLSHPVACWFDGFKIAVRPCSGDIDIAVRGDKLELAGEGCLTTVALLTSNEDLLAAPPPIAGSPSEPNCLAAALARVSWARTTDDTRYVMRYVLWDAAASAFVATDGKQLAFFEVESGLKDSVDADLLLPPTVVDWVIMVAKSATSDLQLRVSPVAGEIVAKVGDIETRCHWEREGEPTYPHWRQVLPDSIATDTIVEIRRDEFAKSLAAFAKKLPRESKSYERTAILIADEVGRLSVLAKTKEGEFSESLPCVIASHAFELVIRVGKFLDAVAAAPDEKVEIFITRKSIGHPFYFNSKTTACYRVAMMPSRI